MPDLDTSYILANFAVSGVGFVFFSYGKKLKKAPQIITGLILMVFPYFVPNTWIMLSIAAVLLAGFWYAWKQQIFY
jgi:hypothetical protein